MAIINEAVPGRLGTLLYSAQTTKGTPVTPATSAGIASFDVESDAGLVPIFTLGQAAALFIKDGENVVRATINIPALQDEALIARVLRSSGVVPWNTFGFGVKDDAATVYAWQVSDAKINTLDLSLDAPGFLQATLGIIGGPIADLTTGMAPANLSPTPYRHFEAVLQKGGSAYEAIGFRLNINNNATPEFVIPGAAPASFKRGWTYLPEGVQNITGEIRRFRRAAVDLQAATISDFTIVLTMTDIAGGCAPNASTITISNAKFGSERQEISPEGRWIWTTPFIAKTCTIA